MNRAVVAAFALSVVACAPRQRVEQNSPPTPTLDERAVLAEASQRYVDVAAARSPSDGYPRATNAQGRWVATPMNEWTSGFFPGTLWYLYSHTNDSKIREQAERWTWPLFMIPRGNYSHDLGFQFNSSFVNAHRFTSDARFRAPALNAARLLAARFNPKIGAIKSWDWMPSNRPFPVIVDNMMNLELLFWGARQPDGDARWKQIAVAHARTTIANHIRPDGGSYHVVVFDPKSGVVLERITHQGHADASTWARGQAWLIYGFTTAYRETGEPEFLATALRVADYFIQHLPSDHIPCWDFQAPNCPGEAKRDASAAAIAASGLLELSEYAHAKRARYQSAAQYILATLSSPEYRKPAHQSESLVQHAVGNMPAGTEIDVGLSYADYYYVEGLLRLSGRKPVFTPRTITTRGELLRESRERIARNDRAATAALRQLLHEADSTLTLPPFTVTAKTRVPPSGDKRDYMSFGPYWWPDSTKPNGLPYIRRDGEVNWELRRESDALRLYAFTDAVETLALAHYLTGEAKYAERATTLIRTWFFDPQTRMNPHLRYAQAIPGVSEGRGIGIIDTRGLGRITDATALLAASPAWTAQDEAALRQWMREYLDWLIQSEHGRDEADEPNNHGTWYDVQIASLALYLADTATARATLAESVPRRLNAQIDTSGRQPLELARTRSLHYSVENLDAMTQLAELARHVGVDLWRSTSEASVKLRKAVEFVAPYSDTTRKWTAGQQITEERSDLFVPVLARAAYALADERFWEYLKKYRVWEAHRKQFLYPESYLEPDTLLSNTRISALPEAERTAWQRYIAVSDSNRLRDRAAMDAELRAAGKARWTPAPAGSGFFADNALERTPANSAAARELAHYLVSYQTPSGGWSKRINFTRARQPGESFASEQNWSWIGTLDNGGTAEQLQFLAAVLRNGDDTELRNSYVRGVQYLLTSQFPNGCWPQIYPLQGSYHDAVTFNDDATINALRVLRGVARGEVTGLPTALRDRATTVVARGIDCIVKSQVVIAGKRTVWGPQHDPLTLVPVKARAYEHASLSGRESAAIVDFLMQVENPSADVINAIHSAVDWFNSTAIRGYTYMPRGELTPQPGAGPLWARFYELGTNRPIFSDRDGIVRYNLSEVGAERRRGYLWYTDEPSTTLRRYERWARNHPRQ
jgi:PelA/Pel-15E family pectate lyase